MNNDHNIDALLRDAAKKETRSVSGDLMARVLADAQRLQPDQRPMEARKSSGGLSAMLDAIGGWLGPAAIAASLCLGIGIGAANPTFLSESTLSGLLGSTETVDELDSALGLGEFDLTATEW